MLLGGKYISGEHAAATGNWRALWHMLEHNPLALSSPSCCAAAAEAGGLQVLRWLRERGTPWDEAACARAAAQGHLDVLRYAREESVPPCPWDEETTANAAEAGQVECLRYALRGGCPATEQALLNAMDLAVLVGGATEGLRAAELLLAHGVRPTTDAYDKLLYLARMSGVAPWTTQLYSKPATESAPGAGKGARAFFHYADEGKKETILVVCRLLFLLGIHETPFPEREVDRMALARLNQDYSLVP